MPKSLRMPDQHHHDSQTQTSTTAVFKPRGADAFLLSTNDFSCGRYHTNTNHANTICIIPWGYALFDIVRSHPPDFQQLLKGPANEARHEMGGESRVQVYRGERGMSTIILGSFATGAEVVTFTPAVAWRDQIFRGVKHLNGCFRVRPRCYCIWGRY